MASFEQELGLPEEWLSADDEQKQRWVAEAAAMFEKDRKVPENSVYSFAICWDFFRKNQGPKKSKPISNTKGRRLPPDISAEAIG